MAFKRADPGVQDVMGSKRYEFSELTDATLHVSGAITATGATDFAECSYATVAAIQVENGAANSVTSTPEGSIDGINFVGLAYKVLGTATVVVAATPRVTPAATKEILVLQDIPNVRFIRMNVGTANANGTSFRAFTAGI